MKTRFYIMMTRKYIIINMYLHILRHFSRWFWELRSVMRLWVTSFVHITYVCGARSPWNRRSTGDRLSKYTRLYRLHYTDYSWWIGQNEQITFLSFVVFSLSIFGVWIWIWWSDHVSITCRVHPGQTFKCSDRFRLSSSLSIRILRSSALSRVLSDSRWRTLCNKHTKTQTSERTRFFYNYFSTYMYINNLNNLYLLDSIS